jgi:hypothetical protein
MEEMCSLSGTNCTFTYDPQQFFILQVSSMIVPEWRQQKNAGIDNITGFAYTQTQRDTHPNTRELLSVLNKVERTIFKDSC